MDFLDEDAKPRFMFQSRGEEALSSSDSQSQLKKKNKKALLVLAISIAISIFLFTLTFFIINYTSELITSLLFWVASSLLLGPFAPSSLTAGDILVGQGPIVHFPQFQPHLDSKQFKHVKKTTTNFPKQQQQQQQKTTFEVSDANSNSISSKITVEEQDTDWTQEDFELLKKQMLKHPVGMPRRWEVIAGAFNGTHKLESVVKMAKSLPDKKLSDGDSFARFLKDRKPLDNKKRAAAAAAADEETSCANDELLFLTTGGEKEWSAEEDIALLNALKAFPKDVSMRWEKIAAAVPGKTKSACMKRVTLLKRGFRSSKASSEAS